MDSKVELAAKQLQSAAKVRDIWGGIVVNAKGYGAKGDGATDDTAAIATALTALKNAGGGILLFPSGTYLANININYGYDNITLEGTGPSTVIKVSSTMHTTGGEAIAIRGTDASNKVKNVTIRNMKIVNQETSPVGNGIGITKTESILIENVWTDGCTNYGVTVESENENVRIVNHKSTNNAKSGIALTSSSTRRVKVVNPILESNAEYGLYITYNIGTTMEELEIVNPTCRFNTKAGIWTSHFDHSSIIGGIISDNTEEGCFFQNQKGSKIVGATIQNNGNEGIRLSNVDGMSVIGCDICDNAYIGSQKYGIRIHNLSANINILGGNIGNVNRTSQNYGVRLDANNNRIIGTKLSGNAVGLVQIGGGFSGNVLERFDIDPNVASSITTASSMTKRIRGASAPTAGTWAVGDVVENTAPTLLKNISHWKCITAGTPGTWVAYGCGTGTTANRPTLGANDAGYLYRDTTTGTLVFWSGSAWV